MLIFILLFFVVGFVEIGGGYLVWLWLREVKLVGYGIVGVFVLIVYGIFLMF